MAICYLGESFPVGYEIRSHRDISAVAMIGKGQLRLVSVESQTARK